jgi:hypothetical protein
MSRDLGTLRAFFLPLTRRTLAELGLGEPEVAEYLAGVLASFARTDRLYRIAALGAHRPTTLVEFLELAGSESDAENLRELHRHIGDFALFMSGLFRPYVQRLGVLGWYLAEGARAYGRVAALGLGEPRAKPLLFAELSDRFEHYSGALDYLRKVRFPGLASRDPFAEFLREIDSIVRGLSRN